MKRQRELDNDEVTNDSFHSDLEDMQEEEFNDVFDTEFVFLSKRLQQSGEELLCIKNHFASFINKLSETFLRTASEKDKMKKCIHTYLEFSKIFADINKSLSFDELPDIKQLLYEEDTEDEEEDYDNGEVDEDVDIGDEDEDVEIGDDDEDDSIGEDDQEEEEDENGGVEDDGSDIDKGEGSISSQEDDEEETEDVLDMGSFNFYNWFGKHIILSTPLTALEYENVKS